mgnify:FL=1|nr:MAG TPA: helix-turn-helix domain protein [Caudoviricetes sp.]
MPRVNLGRDKCREDLVALIWGKCAVLGINNGDLAEKLGVCRQTVSNYKKNPKKYLTVEDVLKICRFLNIPLEELRAAIHY